MSIFVEISAAHRSFPIPLVRGMVPRSHQIPSFYQPVNENCRLQPAFDKLERRSTDAAFNRRGFRVDGQTNPPDENSR